MQYIFQQLEHFECNFTLDTINLIYKMIPTELPYDTGCILLGAVYKQNTSKGEQNPKWQYINCQI